MGNSVIKIRGLCKSYKKHEVLHDFSLTVEQGHICGLIGPNGAGIDKSGYIIADETTATPLRGVFAAGDVRTKELRQIVTAVADGAVAADMAEKYISAM